MAKKFNQKQVKTYIIEYCMAPDYEKKHFVEKTAPYLGARHAARILMASGQCIILDIRVKE